MKKVTLYAALGLAVALAVATFAFKDSIPMVKNDKLSYTIEKRWELPMELQEISGIAWLEDNMVAAVQDEDAIIYIYDLDKGAIVKKIHFGEPGDYEGIAIDGFDAYVLRSDGDIFAISNFEDDDRKIERFKTPFKSDNNMETLFLDKKRNSLLICPKDHGLGSDDFKGVYAFSLDGMEMVDEPVLKISMTDKVLKSFKEKNLFKTFRPSDMAINPITKELFVLEGSKPKLLILHADGKPKDAYELDKKMFPQPEGILFTPSGELYISSEGKKNAKGTITKLKILDKE